jgi:hypothetical protein
VLIHEVTTGRIVVFAETSAVAFAVHSISHATMTNLDTGLTIEWFGPASIFTMNDFVRIEHPDGSVTYTSSDRVIGLNGQVKTPSGVTILAGLSIAHYSLTFDQNGLVTFSIEYDNTPHQAHASATICALLAPQ